MEENNIEQMSKEELMDVFKLGAQIYNNGMYGLFTPQLQNSNLISLNNNPLIPTKEKVYNAINSYKENAKELQAYSEFCEVFSKLYSRTLEYYANILSFDMKITCKNAYAPEKDYKSDEYKKDLRRVYKFLDNFNYKAEFLKVLKETMRREIVFTWFRDTEGTFSDSVLDLETSETKKKKLSKYTIQFMPQQNCLLTGQFENGLLYDFDMNYFLRGGVSINSYDPQFKKYFNEVFGDNSAQKYNPNKDLDTRNGSFATWVQTSPEDGAWAWKFDMSNMNAVPFLTSMINLVLTDDEILRLQTDKSLLEARAMIVGEIPLIDNSKSGTTQNQTAYSTEFLMKFLQLAKMGLDKNVTVTAMPTINPEMYQYENKNKEMYQNQLKATGANGASAGRLIYSDDKMSESELQNAIVTDYNLVKRMYSQFNNFMNFYINKKTKKYKFNFEFDGSTYPFIRELDQKQLLAISSVGMVLNSSCYASFANMPPHSFDRALEEGHYGDFADKLTMLLSVHTQSGTSETGAPKKDSTEIKDSGATSRDYN